MPYTSGGVTYTTVDKIESHKLFSEFEADGTIHKGQPVTLHADGDKVTAADTSTLAKDIIGFSIHEGNSIYGDFVTVALKGYAIINTKAAEVVVPGPVVFAGYDVEDAYPGDQAEFAGYNLVGGLTGSAVAQVETVTLTGTVGTASVTMGGLTKSIEFITSLAATHAAFVAAHADAYDAIGITLTGTTTLIFTAATAGIPFAAGEVVTLVTDLTGTVVHTTASEAAGADTRIWGWAIDAAAAAGEIVRTIISA